MDNTNVAKIKNTKGFMMEYYTDTRRVVIYNQYGNMQLEYKDIFPLIRGLISLTQRFYRKAQK